MKIKLFRTDYVRLVDNKIADDLDTIYAEESLKQMLQDMKENGQTLLPNERYVRMTELSFEQQQKYINYLNKQRSWKH